MKVILKQEMPGLGKAGEVVDVSDGYGRNFLLPGNKAVTATTKNIKHMDHERKLIEHRQESERREAEKLAKKLEGMSCTVAKHVGEEEKLFGSVTNRDIEEAFALMGISIPRRNIVLTEPIKTLGVYTVDVKLHSQVTGKVKVWVVAK